MHSSGSSRRAPGGGVGRRACALALLLVAGGCAGPPPPARIEGILAHATAAARAHHEAGRDAEAAQLLRPVLRLDPERDATRRLWRRLGETAPDLFDHPLLGSNFARRPRVERGTAARVLLFLPDRLLDLADLVSFDLHLGFGAYANVHATRALQVGAGMRSVAGVGWHDHRSLGVRNLSESGLTLVGVGTHAVDAFTAGTSGLRSTSDAIAGLHRPQAWLYQDLRDYWEVGAELTAGVLGVDVGLHPVELADALAGWVGRDPLQDDWAGTRTLALSDEEVALIRRLAALQRSEAARASWRRYREGLPPPGD